MGIMEYALFGGCLMILLFIISDYVPKSKRDFTCHYHKRIGTCERNEDGYCASCHASYY